MKLLLVRLGRYLVVNVHSADEAQMVMADSQVYMAAQIDESPMLVLKDRRRPCPYYAEHRTLEEWVLQLCKQLEELPTPEIKGNGHG